MTTAEKLRKARIELGYSQDYVAKNLGMSRSTVAQIELGNRKVSTDEAADFCRLYHISSDYLLGTEDLDTEEAMYARGFEFMPIDIFRAKAKHFQIIDGKLMQSLNSIEGMGDKAAEGVVEAAKDGPFTSCENFKNRCKVSGTIVYKMRNMGLLGDLPLSDQMSLLDFM